VERATVGAGRTLVLPALANAHDPRAAWCGLSQVGSFDVPLEAWLPYLALIPAVDPWLASVVSFGRTARGGVGSVMAHYTRVQGITDFPTEARAVGVETKAGRASAVNLRWPCIAATQSARLRPAFATARASVGKSVMPCTRVIVRHHRSTPPRAVRPNETTERATDRPRESAQDREPGFERHIEAADLTQPHHARVIVRIGERRQHQRAAGAHGGTLHGK